VGRGDEGGVRRWRGWRTGGGWGRGGGRGGGRGCSRGMCRGLEFLLGRVSALRKSRGCGQEHPGARQALSSTLVARSAARRAGGAGVGAAGVFAGVARWRTRRKMQVRGAMHAQLACARLVAQTPGEFSGKEISIASLMLLALPLGALRGALAVLLSDVGCRHGVYCKTTTVNDTRTATRTNSRNHHGLKSAFPRSRGPLRHHRMQA
jgi:hypothetical protein